MKYGNRYRYGIDDIIVAFIKRKREDFVKNTEPGKVLGTYTIYSYSDKPGLNVCFSFSKIYRAVRDGGYPGVSRTTIHRHLNKMVDRGTLVRWGKLKVGNTIQRLYSLAPTRTIKSKIEFRIDIIRPRPQSISRDNHFRP
jgi:hypothetical protein